jgi:hypothetical protein
MFCLRISLTLPCFHRPLHFRGPVLSADSGLFFAISLTPRDSKSRSFSTCQSATSPKSKKIRPCAHSLEALQNPGWSAQRHRRGRRFCESRQVRKKSPPQSSTRFSLRRPPPLAEGRCRSARAGDSQKSAENLQFATNRDLRSRAPPPPPPQREVPLGGVGLAQLASVGRKTNSECVFFCTLPPRDRTPPLCGPSPAERATSSAE